MSGKTQYDTLGDKLNSIDSNVNVTIIYPSGAFCSGRSKRIKKEFKNQFSHKVDFVSHTFIPKTFRKTLVEAVKIYLA